MTSIDPQALTASLKRLSARDDRLLLSGSLQRVVDACVELFDVDGSGIMLADEQSALRYAVSTDGAGQLLEKAQLEANAGPCLDTFVTAEQVGTPDVTSDPRWPAVAAQMAGTGVAAVLGVPITLAGITVGSLDVYKSAPHEWDEAERDALTQYGRVVEAMIEAAVSAEQAGELANQLHYALDYRVPIERGIGYLMCRDGNTAQEAFTKLRRAARNSRRKVGDIAEHLLRTGTLPEETT